ncbi:hypothetical protein BVC80_9009g49 [Macleaya cordata]|uniref:Protein NUCLEAR FUSION DEFECTIVE 6, chloroplastic/mitochondrial-like n=1 Tax=Macleaya cordata TaxID=56857 RepID=A0A200QM50_MACCD|nr:hypothetical protein BVC80_9009g49 [Macleaya cordata]
MAISAASARSFIRSASSFRSAAARVASQAKPKSAPSPSFFSKQKPLSQRIFRSPVEMSCCVESLMPFHSANSSALLISKLGVSCQPYGWLLEGKDESR